MHSLSRRTSPRVDTLYVKSLASFAGPQYSIQQIFNKARQSSPCLLIFEDIDSLITPGVRSYFLNAVDGLETNHGILMIGSTNHIDQLDPGISRRPSRFDRKYEFADPNEHERVLYCRYWRRKLTAKGKVDFPEQICYEAAALTQGFSFAFLKEAFVAALLVIAADFETVGGGDGDDDDDLKHNQFWQELRRQIENLRREMS